MNDTNCRFIWFSSVQYHASLHDLRLHLDGIVVFDCPAGVSSAHSCARVSSSVSTVSRIELTQTVVSSARHGCVRVSSIEFTRIIVHLCDIVVFVFPQSGFHRVSLHPQAYSVHLHTVKMQIAFPPSPKSVTMNKWDACLHRKRTKATD